MLSDAGVTRQTIYRWIGSQCTFWCSVLSDPEDGDFLDDSYQTKSQCTFWCSVLSDSAHPCGGVIFACLNAPSGAQCFPTRILRRRGLCGLSVSMHLLVLSAFRPVVEDRVPSSLLSQCTFWCSVLSDATNKLREAISTKSQCTFWCSVLSDRGRLARQHVPYPVSMHLLVLSAFRLSARHSKTLLSSRLNAPSGAQCFPTPPAPRRVGRLHSGLNAPSGAQCFPTSIRVLLKCKLPVSMHLLVLSAFRPKSRVSGFSDLEPSQCTFWCSVLSDRMTCDRCGASMASQCTFWCSVLSDSAPRKPRHNAVYRNEIAADLESTTSNRLAPVQLNHTTAKNRHKTTQRRRRPLPTSTPPTSNEPKPKNRPLTTTSR